MASRTVKVVILCEGSEDYDFARRALVRLGMKLLSVGFFSQPSIGPLSRS